MTTSFAHAQVVINEICVDNERLLADNDGEYPDWIEIHNFGNEAINIYDWSLSDDSDNLLKWTFPSFLINPGEFLIVFASGKNKKSGIEFHTSFKLDENEEHCFLTNSTGQLVSAIQRHTLPSDLSYGRIPDGIGECFYFTKPTPGGSNNAVIPEFFDQNTLIEFSAEGGFYNSAFDLEIINNDPLNTIIRYTTDGSVVNNRSQIYSVPIVLESIKKIQDGSSFIATSDTWKTPRNGVNKIQIIRATPFIDDIQVGPEVVNSYIICDDFNSHYPADVISLSIDDDDFFSDTSGIYIHGINTNGNFNERGINWERKTFMEYFSADRTSSIRQSVGSRIHGRSSRNSPQKSLRLYARQRYGIDHISLSGFADCDNQLYKQITLRAPEPLFSTSLFTDELVQTLLKDMNLDIQAQRPTVVFINGEYWGLHHIRERIGKHYLEQHYGIDEDNVDILDWDRELVVLEGDATAYEELISFVTNNDLSSPSNYEIIESKIDIPSFIDYLVAQLYFSNEDFPDNNVRLWRERTENAKWRFFFFDADATMQKHWLDHLPDFLNGNSNNDPVSILFSNLLKNDKFKQTFSATFINHLSTTLSPDRILNTLEEFKITHEPLVPEHINRWNRPNSMGEWNNAIATIRHFAIMRPPQILQDLDEYFPKPFDIFPNPAIEYFSVRFFVSFEDNIPQITMSDVYGKSLSVQSRFEGSTVLIDSSSLPSGVYLIRVDMGKMSYCDKLIVTR